MFGESSFKQSIRNSYNNSGLVFKKGLIGIILAKLASSLIKKQFLKKTLEIILSLFFRKIDILI